MRSGMKDKPLDYPREYVEVHITTAERKHFEWAALKNDMTISQFIRWKMLPRDDHENHLTELQKIKKWEKQIADTKAHQKKISSENKKIVPPKGRILDNVLAVHLQVPRKGTAKAINKYLVSKALADKNSAKKKMGHR